MQSLLVYLSLLLCQSQSGGLGGSDQEVGNLIAGRPQREKRRRLSKLAGKKIRFRGLHTVTIRQSPTLSALPEEARARRPGQQSKLQLLKKNQVQLPKALNLKALSRKMTGKSGVMRPWGRLDGQLRVTYERRPTLRHITIMMRRRSP